MMKCSLKTNITIDLALFAATVVMSVSGIVLKIIAPLAKGEGFWHDFAVWVFTISRRTWKNIHIWAGIAMLVLLAVHLVCHWSTIDGFFKRYIPNVVLRWMLYVVLVALLLISVVPWIFII